MKITGAAPKIGIPTILFLIITVIIDYIAYPLFKITKFNYFFLIAAGIALVICGIIIVFLTGRKLLKSYKDGYLMTDGLYRIFRNPMYAAYLLFIIPGICLFFNSWLVLSSVIVNFVLLQVFIKEEYRYLEEKFGDDYRDYLKKVRIKFL